VNHLTVSGALFEVVRVLSPDNNQRLGYMPTQNGFKEGGVLSPVLFNIALEYSIRNVQENQVGLKLKGTQQLLANAYGVNVLGDDTET
jgi:hypothetical protein